MKHPHLMFCSLFAGLCLFAAGPMTPSISAADEEPAAEESTSAEEHEAGHEPGEEESDHAHHDGDGHGEAGHDTGPPLKPESIDLPLFSFIAFVILVLVLGKFAWGPLIEGLDNREAHFRNQLAEAEAARVQAEKMLKEHAAKLDAVQDEVRAIIDEAKRDAEHTKNDIIAQAQKEAQATQDRAIHEIERSRDAALKELFDTLSGQVASATEHVIGRSLDGDDQNRLIDEALSQFSGQ